jgi:hypothetical protein
MREFLLVYQLLTENNQSQQVHVSGTTGEPEALPRQPEVRSHAGPSA